MSEEYGKRQEESVKNNKRMYVKRKTRHNTGYVFITVVIMFIIGLAMYLTLRAY